MKRDLFLHDGAAAAECALLMLIFVPVFLYAAFLGEAGILLLETQEQVISAIWDFSTYPYNMDESPKWLDYDGRDHARQDQISAHNRLQYADMDSSFTNESRFVGNTMDMRTDYFSTLAFVQPTHCDGDCKNYRHDYADRKVHEVVCGKEDSDLGGFLEGKVPFSSTAVLQKKSRGGLVVCQEKARLKNYLLMKKFLPEFISMDLWQGDKYRAGARVIDNKSEYRDIVVRHRGVLLTDSWALLEPPARHRDTNSLSLLDRDAVDSPLHSLTNDVLNGSMLAFPTLAAVSYMRDAISKDIAIPLALPLGALSSRADKGSVSKALQLLTNLGGLAGLPNIMGLSLVATYSHDGKNLRDYKYRPLGDTGDLLFTTPLFGEYEKAWNERGTYYLGAREQGKDA